jgi:DNA invertase Pin-like site-specific DNA recombinase
VQPVIIPYQRVSTLKQASDPEKGIARQKRRTHEASLKLSAEYGYKIIDPVTDLGKSAFHEKNWKADGGMGLIGKWVETGVIAHGSILVFEDFDRFSRAEPMIALEKIINLLKQGLRIYSSHLGKIFDRESMNQNMTDIMMVCVFITTAHLESKKKSERTTNSHEHQVKNAIKNNTPVTFGLLPPWIEIVNGKYEVIPSRVELIDRMVDLCINQNMGTQAICRVFNSEQIPIWNIRRETAKIWGSGRVHSILTDRAMFGEKTFNIKSGSYLIENHYPALVDQDTFNRLNLRFQQRKENRSVNRTSSTITNFVAGVGITECGYCGCAFVAKTIKRSTKTEIKRDRILMCRSGQDFGQNYCSCARILHRILERVVIEFCSDRINFQSIFDQNSLRTELIHKKDILNIKLNDSEKKRKKLLVTFMEEDDIDPMIEGLIRGLKVEISDIKVELIEVERSISNTSDDDLGDQFFELVDQVKVQNIPEETRQKLRLLIPQFIKKIVLYPYGTGFVREAKRERILNELAETGCYTPQELEQTRLDMEFKHKNQLCIELFFKTDTSRFIRVHKKYGTWTTIADHTDNGQFNMKIASS